ncbi:hypothetical protein [Amycolatopsis thermophila]|uniref:Uncharacterized protein n=1 Tax=Amycolatopsis thermophila TaxID=206084 RepID=A0ABU0F130_9PSEU|nr:hypothetical protein [Amycolatopsis thermophila]MDQ0380901.1 hypothetical protein [Amycolatopsis thermophila]
MNGKENNQPDSAAGIPEPDPPRGGPNADDETPNPADLAPGFGGTSRTRPTSTEEDSPSGDGS